MNLKINVPVKLVSHNSQFKVKLAEVDTFYDDTLAESEVIDIPIAKEIISGSSAATYEFKPINI